MKDIPGFEGKYAITEDGQVWSYYSNRFIAWHNTRLGYKEALLSNNGKRKHYQIHRLVMMTYAPVEGMNNLDVNHIDEDKNNNHIDNLQWVSHRDNCNYGSRNEKIAAAAIIREAKRREE